MTRSIELHDREEYKRSMREFVTIDPTKTVALTVDMQRDYLDPSIATAPVRAEVAGKVVADTVAMLDLCRESGIPVVHCYVSRRPEEAALGRPQRALYRGGPARRALTKPHRGGAHPR